MNKNISAGKGALIIVGVIISLFVLAGIIATLGDTEPASPPAVSTVSNENSSVQKSFSDLAQARFDEIKTSIPELDRIECYEGKCDSVVYFRFNSLPDDLEFIIRGNTATFSKFKMDNTGVSHVTIVATYQGRTVFTCSGSKGIVDSCE